jgi:hypothetical protein
MCCTYQGPRTRAAPHFVRRIEFDRFDTPRLIGGPQDRCFGLHALSLTGESYVMCAMPRMELYIERTLWVSR